MLNGLPTCPAVTLRRYNTIYRIIPTLFFSLFAFAAFGGEVKIAITSKYLNIPIGNKDEMKVFKLQVNGATVREFPAQLAEDTIGYWVFIDVSEFKGQTITISGDASSKAISRIYQADHSNGEDSLYKESNRPQFHFTVKRGWSNDVNGPIYYNGQYHLFWQYFPFGVQWNTGFMYWGHATSNDLVHWKDEGVALMLDSLGSPWSGTAVIDKNNDGGWGKNALVLFYACYDRVTNKQVQCIAYSNDDGKTFTRIKGNPVVDTDGELKTTDTRDPKVFWYEPAKVWVLVLFEKDGMSFFNSTDLRHWKRQSHFTGLWECPDFFELPVDGNNAVKKWVLHGGSSDYFIGSFDGKTFTPETDRLRYAEGKNENGDDALYAAESFENMPGGRRVQMAWGRINHAGMPFTQMILFPTEFALKTTPKGIRLMATPIHEIEKLHKTVHSWKSITAQQANSQLNNIQAGPLHIKCKLALGKGNKLTVLYQGNEILSLSDQNIKAGDNDLEILIDKTVVEVFINNGEHYIVNNLPAKKNETGFEFNTDDTSSIFKTLQVYEMSSMWGGDK